jgi:hypothetical protein
MTLHGRIPGRAFPAMLALAVSGALAMTAPAMAQTPAAAAATTPPAAAAAPAHRSASAQVERQITRLHSQLKITAAEAPQWDAFTQVMRDNAMALDDAYQQRSAQFANLNAVDGLKNYQQIVQAHADGLNKLVPAFATLYAAMSPEQQKTADEVFHYQAERQMQHSQSSQTKPGVPNHG